MVIRTKEYSKFIYCVVKGSKNVIIIGLILCYQYGKKLINSELFSIQKKKKKKKKKKIFHLDKK